MFFLICEMLLRDNPFQINSLFFQPKVEANDPDADINGQIKYSIEFGNSEGYFSMDEDTGAITLAKTIPLQENKILEFPLYITATDRRFQWQFLSLPLLLKIHYRLHSREAKWKIDRFFFLSYRGHCTSYLSSSGVDSCSWKLQSSVFTKSVHRCGGGRAGARSIYCQSELNIKFAQIFGIGYDIVVIGMSPN